MGVFVSVCGVNIVCVFLCVFGVCVGWVYVCVVCVCVWCFFDFGVGLWVCL